jgi:hypothetical protein
VCSRGDPSCAFPAGSLLEFHVTGEGVGHQMPDTLLPAIPVPAFLAGKARWVPRPSRTGFLQESSRTLGFMSVAVALALRHAHLSASACNLENGRTAVSAVLSCDRRDACPTMVSWREAGALGHCGVCRFCAARQSETATKSSKRSRRPKAPASRQLSTGRIAPGA